MSTLSLSNLQKKRNTDLNEQQALAIKGGIGPLGVAGALAGSGFVIGGTLSTIDQYTTTGSVDFGEAFSAGLNGATFGLSGSLVNESLK